MEFETTGYIDDPTMNRKEFALFVQEYNLPIFCFKKSGEFIRHTMYQGFIITEGE